MTQVGLDDFIYTDEITEAFQHLGQVHAFVTGKAGCGKSTLLQRYYKYGPDKVAIVAPTGVAAVNVGGSTIHRLFGFPVGVTPDEVAEMYPRYPKLWETLDTLIIDEISMVKADMFDNINTFLTRWGPDPSKPFGGVKLALFGDPYQLGPVLPKEEELLMRDYEIPYFWGSHCYSTAGINTIELTKPFRQTDQEFIDALNAIRDGSADMQTLRYLNKRVIGEMSWQYLYESGATMLCTHNEQADNTNRDMLDSIDSPEHYYYADVEGEFPDRNYPTSDPIVLKAGAKVIMLRNHPEQLYVNGTVATVVECHEDHIVVELPTGEEVDVEQAQWDQHEFVEVNGRIVRRAIASYFQIPVKLGWAITIHKSQGLTLDKAILNVGRQVFATGQLYVALSRLRSVEGLTITPRPIMMHDMKVDPRVKDFMCK